jgi:hypothetical protein
MWLNDQKEGPGKFIYKTKRQAYEGEWSQGLPKCGTLVDLLPLPGHGPKAYLLPEVSYVKNLHLFLKVALAQTF